MNRLEAVTVCVNYSDFLAETARHNRHIFDRWVIVTRPEDKATIEVCKRHNLECLTSTEFGRDGHQFNKGRGISLGMAQLATDGWIMHLDSDIVLPRDTRRMLDIADLDPTCIYGADRICLHSWDDWKKLEASGYLHDQHGHHLVALLPNRPPDYDFNCRIIRGRFGWCPIGFLQLFWGSEGVHSGFRWKDYPDTNSDAAHSDIKFALQWDRRKRVLIPEIFVVHLESERVQFGANWKGRKTKPFGPDRGKGHPDPHSNPSPYER